MCLMGGGSSKPPPAPQRDDAAVQNAALEARRRAYAARGRASTNVTGSGDLSPAPGAQKVLLGQ